jgi:CDP-glucose 4,6-dehydratase
LKHWPGKWEDQSDAKAVHEAKLLNLATDKAFHLLAWRPVWGFEKAIAATVEWYRQAADPSSDSSQLADLTVRQIKEYQAEAAREGVVWAAPDATSATGA